MITITILNLFEIIGAEGEIAGQHVDVIVSDGNQSYFVSRGDLPAGVSIQQAQTWLDNRAQAVWDYAVANGRPPDLFGQVTERQLIAALVSLMTDQLNVLRILHGLNALTEAQATQALTNKIVERLQGQG